MQLSVCHYCTKLPSLEVGVSGLDLGRLRRRIPAWSVKHSYRFEEVL